MGDGPKPHLREMCAKPFLATNACLSSGLFSFYSNPLVLKAFLISLHIQLLFHLFFGFDTFLLSFLKSLPFKKDKLSLSKTQERKWKLLLSCYAQHKQPQSKKKASKKRRWRKQSQEERRARNGGNQQNHVGWWRRRCFELRLMLLVTIGSLVAQIRGDFLGGGKSYDRTHTQILSGSCEEWGMQMVFKMSFLWCGLEQFTAVVGLVCV